MQMGLLPTATIDCFWSQNYTADLFDALQQDWRFAQVTLRADKGDITDAIERYRNNPSPALLIIETDRADDAFLNYLGPLAAMCSDQTAALFIGPTSGDAQTDRDFVRQLQRLGVADYLTRPVSVDKASVVVGKILTGRLGHGASRLTAVIGSKGGVGATRIAQALAHSCAQFLHEKTTLVDPAPVNSPFIMAYGITAPAIAATLQPQLDDADAVFDAVHSVSPELKVLALRNDLGDAQTAWRDRDMLALLHTVQQREANLVVDLSQSDPALRKTILTGADAVVVVTTAEPQAVRNTTTLLQDLHAHQPDSPVFLVVNKTQLMQNAEATEEGLTTTLNMEPFVLIPFAADIFTAIEMAAPSTMLKAVQPLAEFVAPLAAAIVGKPAVPLKTSLAVGGMGSMLKLLGGGKKN